MGFIIVININILDAALSDDRTDENFGSEDENEVSDIADEFDNDIFTDLIDTVEKYEDNDEYNGADESYDGEIYDEMSKRRDDAKHHRSNARWWRSRYYGYYGYGDTKSKRARHTKS